MSLGLAAIASRVSQGTPLRGGTERNLSLHARKKHVLRASAPPLERCSSKHVLAKRSSTRSATPPRL